jgi:hypothetical protein
MLTTYSEHPILVCINNTGYEASLEKWKIYQNIPDTQAEKHSEIRIIDEEGEDYLYPAEYFSPITLQESVARSFIEARIDG